jgi:beta-galactosidase
MQCGFLSRLFLFVVSTALLLGNNSALSQSVPQFAPDKMDTVLYGAAYYSEYMPYERLEKDVQLMQQAGISVVRMGESSWGLWEPEDGRFDYAWMDRVIDRMQQAGIKVIMGTPTYSVPAWMYKEHPEIFITRFGGQTVTYGMRQNTDLASPVYRFYCERIIRKLLEHYKNNPTIVGWQIDNETSSGGAANPDIQVGFV